MNTTEQALMQGQIYRDNDRELVLKVWEIEGFILTPEQRIKFMQVTFPDTITRDRRDLRDKYPATPSVELNRRKHQAEKTAEYAKKAIIKNSEISPEQFERMTGVAWS